MKLQWKHSEIAFFSDDKKIMHAHCICHDILDCKGLKCTSNQLECKVGIYWFVTREMGGVEVAFSPVTGYYEDLRSGWGLTKLWSQSGKLVSVLRPEKVSWLAVLHGSLSLGPPGFTVTLPCSSTSAHGCLKLYAIIQMWHFSVDLLLPVSKDLNGRISYMVISI